MPPPSSAAQGHRPAVREEDTYDGVMATEPGATATRSAALAEATAAALLGRLGAEPDVLVAYLFGSQARGTATPRSEVDVAVLLAPEPAAERHPELIDLVADVVGSARTDVVVLNHAPVALAYRVLKDGRPLVVNDEGARVRHCVETVDRYLDMAPLRRTLEQGLRHRLEGGGLVEAESVRRRLREIDHRLGLLESIRAGGRDALLADIGRQAQAERHLQLGVRPTSRSGPSSRTCTGPS